MEELTAQAVDILTTLNEEQVRRVLAYAQGLKDGDEALVVNLEELLETSA